MFHWRYQPFNPCLLIICYWHVMLMLDFEKTHLWHLLCICSSGVRQSAWTNSICFSDADLYSASFGRMDLVHSLMCSLCDMYLTSWNQAILQAIAHSDHYHSSPVMNCITFMHTLLDPAITSLHVCFWLFSVFWLTYAPNTEPWNLDLSYYLLDMFVISVMSGGTTRYPS